MESTDVGRLLVLQADITGLDVDAVVAPANRALRGGGGANGAIHLAAGPQLLTACEAFPEITPGVRCPTGESRLTPAFALKARFVIHTVTPKFLNGESGEPALLVSCYQSTLALARAHAIHSIAFPALGCGAHAYPVDAAARIAVHEVRDALRTNGVLERVLLVARERYVLRALHLAVRNMRVVR